MSKDSKEIKTIKDKLLKEPCNFLFYLEIGSLYGKERRVLSEINSYKLGLILSPYDLEGRILLGQALMKIDNYILGLELFESRIQLNRFNGIYPPESNRIKNLKDLISCNGEILVIAEMGRGDMIQFARYATILKSKYKKLIGIVPEDLKGLFARSNLFDSITSFYSSKNSKNLKWIPFTSMAKLVKASRKNPIIKGTYLYAEKSIVKKWQRLISPDAKFLICLNWSAQRFHLEKNLDDSRHIPIEEFSIIANIEGVAVCSVQKGISKNHWEECSFKDKFIRNQKIIDKSESFEDTAAILKCCNACITVDTSVAHLSGALGVNTWILLKFNPCWRWGIGQNGVNESAWYKSSKISCQQKPGDWSNTIKNVANDLSLHLNNQKN